MFDMAKEVTYFNTNLALIKRNKMAYGNNKHVF